MSSDEQVHNVQRRIIMALRGSTSTRRGYKVPTAPEEEAVKKVETPQEKVKTPKKRKGLFTKQFQYIFMVWMSIGQYNKVRAYFKLIFRL